MIHHRRNCSSHKQNCGALCQVQIGNLIRFGSSVTWEDDDDDDKGGVQVQLRDFWARCIKHFWPPSQKAEAALPEPLTETAPPGAHLNVALLSGATEGPAAPPQGDLAQPPAPEPLQTGQPGSDPKVPHYPPGDGFGPIRLRPKLGALFLSFWCLPCLCAASPMHVRYKLCASLRVCAEGWAIW